MGASRTSLCAFSTSATIPSRSANHAATRQTAKCSARDLRLCVLIGGALTSRRGVEVGNIFQLGSRYTDALGVSVLDAGGVRRSVIMGSYGIGVSRLLARLVERFHDDRGIALTAATSAFDVHIVVLGRDAAGLDERASSLAAAD